MNKRRIEKQKYFANNGITLVALIITIVVMLILVGVTIKFAIGNDGIILRTKEAKFKAEVSQIKDLVDIEREVMVAISKKDGIEKTTFTEGEMKQLMSTVPEGLKTKYEGKIGVENDGYLHHSYEDDSNEAQWCEEIGIIKNGFSGEQLEKNLYTKKQEIMAENPNYTFAFIMDLGHSNYCIMSGEEYKRCREESQGIFDESCYLKVIKEDGQIYDIQFDGKNYVEFNNSDNYNIDFTKFMNKSEAESLFTFETFDSFDDDSLWGHNNIMVERLKITGYKGEREFLTIPGLVKDDSTHELKHVAIIGENVFATNNNSITKIPLYLMFSWTLEEFTAFTVTELKSELESMLGTTIPDNPTRYTDDINGKNNILIDVISMLGLTSDDYELENINNVNVLYIYIDMEDDEAIPVSKPANYKVAISDLVITEGIVQIDDNAFANNVIGSVYLPTTLYKVGTTIFNNVYLKGQIRTNMTRSEFSNVIGYSYRGMFGLMGSDYTNENVVYAD